MQKRNVRLFKKIIRKVVLGPIRLLNRKKFQIYFCKWMKSVGIRIDEYPLYISHDVFLDEVDYSKIRIEENVTISIGVTILVHDHSITDVLLRYGNQKLKNSYVLREVHLKRNCFIGANTTILPGTTIGENSIVGAGSVVKGNIPDNVVVGGNPCRVLFSVQDYYNKILAFPENDIVKQF